MKLRDNYIKASPAPIENHSGTGAFTRGKNISVLKRHQYIVLPDRLSGDAPKDFIYVYEYGRVRKRNYRKWTPYIAKIGHKWYPVESITEQLMTCLGKEWGFNIASSKLYNIAGQVRFCSEYFLRKDQQLVHGADILSRYLQADSSIITQIDKKGWSQELLTIQFVKKALKEAFPDNANEMIAKLIDLMLFDAIIGNNDRHFFNWGIVRHLGSKHAPYFSPIYDTARGLFWNTSELRLRALEKGGDNNLHAFFVRYLRKSCPKIGWDGELQVNHLQMVENLLVNDDYTFDRAQILFDTSNLEKAKALIYGDFANLLSNTRKRLIIRYLEYRFSEFSKLLN